MESQAVELHSVSSVSTAVSFLEQVKQKAKRTREEETSTKIARKLLRKHYGIDQEPSAQNEDFLRGVLEINSEFSEKQWSQQEDKIIAALYARAVLRAKAKDNKKSKGRYKALACAFEDKAVDQLEKLQKDDMDHVKELLLKSCESWGGLDCISLAVKTRCGRFLALKSAQKAVSSVWNGDIDCQAYSKWFWVKLYLALLFPPMLFSLHYKSDEQNSTENENAGCCWNGLQKIYRFYRAPTVAFRLNVIFYMAFIGIYSYMVLVEFGEKVGWREIVIYVWVFTMVIGEINEAGVDDRTRCAAIKFYVSSTWNVLDILSLTVFTVGGILRPIPFRDRVDVVRIIYSIDLIFFCIRFLQILTVSKLLGPKLVMIKAMFKDMIGFCVILITVMYGYAVAMEAILYPNSRLNLKLPYFLGRKAFFQIFGEMYQDDLEGSDRCTDNATLYGDSNISRCPSSMGIWVSPFLLGGYILLTNVLLLNLLIAMFTTTFERIQKEEEQHWNLERARLVLEYKSGPAFPPPFNVFCIISFFLYKKCCKKDSSADRTGSTANNGGPTTPHTPTRFDMELSHAEIPFYSLLAPASDFSIRKIKSEMEDFQFKPEQPILRLDTLMTAEADAGLVNPAVAGEGESEASPGQVKYQLSSEREDTEA